MTIENGKTVVTINRANRILCTTQHIVRRITTSKQDNIYIRNKAENNSTDVIVLSMYNLNECNEFVI